MRQISRFVVSAFAVVMTLGTTPVLAASPSGERVTAANAKGETIVIDGREYGPKDGLVIDVEQVSIKRGSGEIVFDWQDTPKQGGVTPQATWGSTSTRMRL